MGFEFLHCTLGEDPGQRTDVPKFLIELRTRSSLAARVLEFLILTASRSGEGLGATWNEFDFATRMWTIPPEKMKAGREHRVPLSNRALAIVNSMPRNHERVFPLSKVSLFKLLRAMNRDDITVHGFR
jgi:integrase